MIDEPHTLATHDMNWVVVGEFQFRSEALLASLDKRLQTIFIGCGAGEILNFDGDRRGAGAAKRDVHALGTPLSHLIE